MKEILKVQLPVDKTLHHHALYNNRDNTHLGLIDMNTDKELIDELMQGEEISYCKVEMENGKIIKVLDHLTEKEFLEG